MDRATELLGYYAEHPPGHLILAAVHLKSDRRRRHARVSSESNALSHMHELSSLLGQQPSEPVPDHLRRMAEWAVANSPHKRLS